MSQEEWDAQNQIDVMTIKPAHVVKLMHSSYGNSYITVYQPYVNTAGRLCGAMTVLIKEKMSFQCSFRSSNGARKGFLPDLR